jgi:DNA polymerase-1
LTTPAAPPATALARNLKYDTILTWDALRRLAGPLQAAELVALDTETTSLDEMRAAHRGHQLQREPGEAAYIPLATTTPTRRRSCRATRCWPAQALAGRRRAPKLGQHIKYDRHVFANHGIEVQGYVHDTMLQSYVLEVHKPHGLASLAERHLGRSGISYEDLCGKGAHQIPFARWTWPRRPSIRAKTATMTLDVHQALWPQLQADAGAALCLRAGDASSERCTASSATAC